MTCSNQEMREQDVWEIATTPVKNCPFPRYTVCSFTHQCVTWEKGADGRWVPTPKEAWELSQIAEANNLPLLLSQL